MGNWRSTSRSGVSANPAPNLTGAWLSNVGTWVLSIRHPRSLPTTVVGQGYRGTITPPVGTPDLANLKFIYINRITASGDKQLLLTLYGPFLEGVAYNFKTSPIDPVGITGISLEFVCANEDGSTPNPFVYAMDGTGAPTGTPPAENSIINPREVSPRHQNENGGLNITLGFTPVVDNPVYPMVATFWTKRPVRPGETANYQGSFRLEWRGWQYITGPGEMYLGAVGTPTETQVWPPTVNQEQWTVIFALGAVLAEDPNLPASAKETVPFIINPPGIPSVTASNTAYIGELIIGSGSKRGMFGWKDMTVNLPFADPEFFAARWTVQNGHYTTPGNPFTFVGGGQHNGDEVAFTDYDGQNVYRLPGTDTTVIQNPLLWDVPDYRLEDGTINPNNVFRIKLYVASRFDSDGTGGTWTLQQCWAPTPGDVDGPFNNSWIDIVLDLNVGRPLGANLATSSADGTSHKIPSVVISLGTDGTISLDGLGNIHVNQPALVISNLSGNLTISRISDINNIIIANLQGNLDVSRIQNITTLAIGSLSGNLDISRVNNIGTITIESLSGNLSVSRIQNLTTVSVSSFSGNLDVSRVNNLTLLFISQFQGTLDISRVTNINTIFIASLQGNLDISRVTNVGTINISSLSGNLDVSRVTNITAINIASFGGNLDISRVTNITAINIGTLSGTLNVTLQIADGSIPINKIATLFVQNIQGWDGASINVGGNGLTFSGFGGIRMFNGGNIQVSPGFIQAQSGFRTGFGIEVIDFNAVGKFSSLQIQGATKIDASSNAFFNNLNITGTTTYGGENGETTGALAVMVPGGGTGFLRFTKGALVAHSGL